MVFNFNVLHSGIRALFILQAGVLYIVVLQLRVLGPKVKMFRTIKLTAHRIIMLEPELFQIRS
jgi:hypothetical protein